MAPLSTALIVLLLCAQVCVRSLITHLPKFSIQTSLSLQRQYFNSNKKVVRALGILKLEEPDEKSSKLDKITTLNEEIKKAEEKFLKADDNLDKSFWSEKVQRLTKQLEKEEQLRLTKENEWLTDPRSLFGPLDSVPPLPRKHREEIDPWNGKYPFVNRDKQLMTIWSTWAEGWKSPSRNKAILVSTGQMFGSGKTMFSENVLNFDNAQVRALFASLPSSPAKTAMENTLTVKIDLQLVSIPEFVSTLSEALSLLMWQCTLEQYYDVNCDAYFEFWERSSFRHDPLLCLKALMQLTGKNFYFYFDEINMIDDRSFDYLFSDSTSNKSKDKMVRRYYDFWSELVKVLKDSFVYVTGRSVKFSEKGKGRLGIGQSPSKSVQIYLPRFEIVDIIDIIRPLYMEAFGLKSDDALAKVAEQVFRWTSGIPRPVQYVLYYLNKLEDPASFLPMRWSRVN